MPWHLAIDQAGERRLGQAPDRHDPPRDRADVRRQGVPARDPAAGPLRPEDPPPEDRGRARREERLARARLRRRADRARGARGAVRGLRAAAAPVPRRHVAARRPRAPRRQARAARGRARDAARHRPRHVPVRHLVADARRRRVHRDRDRADADRRGDRRREGVRDARRRRAVPDRDRGARPGARARARRRVRHGHRPRAPLRLARPRRAPLRRAAERDHVDRADEARRALGVRRAAGVHARTSCATGRGPTSSPSTRATSTPPGRSTRRSTAGASELDGDELPEAARRYVEFVEHELDVEVSWVGTGAEREQVLVREARPSRPPRASSAGCGRPPTRGRRDRRTRPSSRPRTSPPRPEDRRAGRLRLGEHRVDLLRRARVVRERDPAPAAVVLDAGVLRELLAAPERDDHPAGLEEDDVVVRRGVRRPAERLVERAGPGEVANAERDQADSLLHQTVPTAHQARALSSKGPSGDPRRRRSASATAFPCSSARARRVRADRPDPTCERAPQLVEVLVSPGDRERRVGDVGHPGVTPELGELAGPAAEPLVLAASARIDLVRRVPVRVKQGHARRSCPTRTRRPARRAG